MKNVSLLGSTGSIGTQTLDVVAAFPERFRAGVLAANRSWEKLAQQARQFRPDVVALGDERHFGDLREALAGTGIAVLAGDEGLQEAASRTEPDIVLSALVGVAGLKPTLAALAAGKPIALANKETLVVGGELVTDLARSKGVPLLPVDSEHSAIFQCLHGEERRGLERIILTASGGPFRRMPRESLGAMTAAQALKHPTWTMGAKITIDSATLMNKGFEVLEALHLFDLRMDQIDVWVHPQSVIHSMVEFVDGSVLAQMGPPDMRTPIQIALAWPERLPQKWARLSLAACRDLTFEEPRRDDFPCLEYAFEAGRVGGTMPAVLNGANEVAVERFLKDEIGFLDIPGTIRACMDAHVAVARPTLDDLVKADAEARDRARRYAPALIG